MKNMIKDLAKNTIISIGMATAIFCFAGVVFDIIYMGAFHLENYQFTKMVIGCLIVGLGFGIPSIIYSKDSLPMPIRVLIHMGIGCIVYTLVAYSVGWLGNISGIGQGILVVALQLGIAFIIWFLFLKYYRKEAKKLNDKIQSMK
ncbi:MAG: DUF3021 domain-containing protein [Lachnospiraceae bacterium]|nr:DUF3021 domain-containing protein [Lachnospiraceae bacterium]